VFGGGSVFLVDYLKGVPYNTVVVVFSVCVALIIAGTFYFIYPFRERPLLENRKPKSVKEIFSEYYSQSGIPWNLFERHWVKIADFLGESPLMLRPTDRFDRELKPRSPIDITNGDLARYVQDCLGKDAMAQNVETMDSLIILLCAKESHNQASNQ